MIKITKRSTIEDVAAIVSQQLTDAGISAVLSGGAVVSIYTENEYESKDLDFVTGEQIKTIAKALGEIGFEKSAGRHFNHPDTEIYVEFPSAPLAIGEEVITAWDKRKTKNGTIQILTPTQCVMDRLAAYIHWNDPQSLDQAGMVAKKQKVNLAKIKSWAEAERGLAKFEDFVSRLKG